METIAFLYKWTELSSGKWYIGSRTAEGCHPFDGYICSSKVVKPKILSNPLDWRREILCFGNQEFILDLEMKYLRKYKVRKDPMSYNRCVSKPPIHNKPHTDEAKAKIKAKRALQKYDENFSAKMSEVVKKRWPNGRPETFKQKMREVSFIRETKKRLQREQNNG
jgi:hypothetical protein